MAVQTVTVKVGKRQYELTLKQDAILKALRWNEWQGPTEVGKSCGRTYDSASSWCTPALRRLMELGLVERSDETPNKGKYRRAKA
jgi:predicted transcriptional regulator